MIVRSKAPLRIGLAGGGTDVSPYSDLHGGAILNATLSLYAYCTIELIDETGITIIAADRDEKIHYDTFNSSLPINGHLDLVKGVYNRILKDFGCPYKGIRITTFVDAPAGSGLGTSSTLVVAIVGAFVELLQLPLGDYDIAHLAYEIEREDLGLAGGKQDQYAATFGGVNFMEFYGDKVIVNPLRVHEDYLHELENNLVLFFTATSRESAMIIKEQQSNVTSHKEESIEAMHQLKLQASQMKEAMLKGKLHDIGAILNFGFEQKRKMAHNITNDLIESIYSKAKLNGATGGKISGAGGGGFMIFYCPANARFSVIEALKEFKGEVKQYNFVQKGLTTWRTK